MFQKVFELLPKKAPINLQGKASGEGYPFNAHARNASLSGADDV